MTIPVQDFNFFVGGMEDSIVARLKTECEYARDVDTYSGELEDATDLRAALEAQAYRFPLFLVSYAEGKNEDQGGLGPGIIAQRRIKHECVFTVLCCDDNARGERDRRRGGTDSIGVFKMMSDVDAALSRMQFRLTIEGESYLLNPEPLNWLRNNYITQLPDLTAYSMDFGTYFILATPDRSTQAGGIVQEIDIEMYPGSKGRNLDSPGVLSD
ncbi:MAG: phage protein Gp37 [Pyrinomonadaceae bacterium]